MSVESIIIIILLIVVILVQVEQLAATEKKYDNINDELRRFKKEIEILLKHGKN